MESKRISVFLDASVLFAAGDSATGASREIIRYLLRRAIDAVISELALEEAERNLAAKRPQALPYFYVLRDTVPFEIVEPTRDEVLAMQPHTAFKDAPILAAAKKADVYCLVSLDRRHMIEKRKEIAKQVGLKILLPAELLNILRQQTVN
jgi:predicted nucleic acid-binding protein